MAHYDANIIYFSYAAAPPKNLKVINDQGHITDSKNIIYNHFVSDIGVGTETPKINVSFGLSETAHAIDKFPNEYQDKFIYDVGHSIDNVFVNSHITLQEICSGTDINKLAILLKINDSGLGTDNIIQNLRSLKLCDNASGSDIVNIINNVLKINDSGLGTDNIIQNSRLLKLQDSGIGTDIIIQNLR